MTTNWNAIAWQGKPVVTVGAGAMSSTGADFGTDSLQTNPAPGNSGSSGSTTVTCGIQEAINFLGANGGGTIILASNYNSGSGYNVGTNTLTVPQSVPIAIRAEAPLQVISYSGSGFALTVQGSPTSFYSVTGSYVPFLVLDGLAFNIASALSNSGGVNLQYLYCTDSFIRVTGSAGSNQVGIAYLTNGNGPEEVHREFSTQGCDYGVVIARDHVVIHKLSVSKAKCAGLQVGIGLTAIGGGSSVTIQGTPTTISAGWSSGSLSNGILDLHIGSFHLFNTAAAQFGILYANVNHSDVFIGECARQIALAR